MTAFKNEREMQRLVGDAIRSDKFANCVVGGEGLKELLDESATVMPTFSIDYLSRLAMVRAAVGCLASLHDIKILTDDQNVSMTKHETLRPDFVGISEENNSIWIIELKNSTQTAREAFTELLGYEHEVKNYLPFLADWDVNFVLISSEWSTLLDHSLASACAWSRKKVLGLESAKDVMGNLKLTVRIPEAWTVTGAVHFPASSLSLIHI